VIASTLITTAFAAAVLAVFALAHFLHTRGAAVERTRKLTHASVAALALGLPPTGISHWFVLVLCGGFGALLLFTARRGVFGALHSIERRSHGIFYFAAAVYLCYVLQEIRQSYLEYYLPLAIMALSDSLAALCGRRWPFGRYTVSGHQKTLTGSTAFFLSALAISISMLSLWSGASAGTQSVLICGAVIAMVCTLVEAFSLNGLDNIAVPLAAAICLQMLIGKS
jgi:phytol kinase